MALVAGSMRATLPCGSLGTQTDPAAAITLVSPFGLARPVAIFASTAAVLRLIRHTSPPWQLATHSNYAGTWIIWDRIFGTCVDGEAEVLGIEGGRRMDIAETMVFPFREGWRDGKAWVARRLAAKSAQEPTE